MFKNLAKLFEINKIIDFTSKRYAGHSKWQNIRHIKGLKDAQRSALFTKISRQMKVAIQEGGSTDVKFNLKLENIIEQAKRANMPAATIQSVIKSCENDKSNSKPHLLEIKGPGSSIVLCEVFTNNIHGLKQTISTILRKHKCKFSDGGGIHLFEEKGIVEAKSSEKTNSEALLEKATDHAIEAGAEDVQLLEEEEDVGLLQFICGTTNLKTVVNNLENFKYEIISASSEFIPLKVQNLDESELTLYQSLYEKLENLPEVVRISDNVA